jgi:hypothetical protein
VALSTSYNDCARGGTDAFEVVSSDYQYEEDHKVGMAIFGLYPRNIFTTAN